MEKIGSSEPSHKDGETTRVTCCDATWMTVTVAATGNDNPLGCSIPLAPYKGGWRAVGGCAQCSAAVKGYTHSKYTIIMVICYLSVGWLRMCITVR